MKEYPHEITNSGIEDLQILLDIGTYLESQPKLDLEGYIDRKIEISKSIKYFRIPLFLLRKMWTWVLNSALVNFTKICNPPWYIFQFIEYADEEFLDEIKDIFLWRMSILKDEEKSFAHISDLADHLNRVSHFQQFDSFLGKIIDGLPFEIIELLCQHTDVSHKWIYFSHCLSQRTCEHFFDISTPRESKKTEKKGFTSLCEKSAIYNIASRKFSTTRLSSIEVRWDMNCTIFNPLKNKKTDWCNQVSDIGGYIQNPHKSDIIIFRGHGVPDKILSVIQQAEPKIVVLGGCQWIDLFLKKIHYYLKEDTEFTWLQEIAYIGTMRLGKAKHNDFIAEYIMRQVRKKLPIDVEYISHNTEGDYMSFTFW